MALCSGDNTEASEQLQRCCGPPARLQQSFSQDLGGKEASSHPNPTTLKPQSHSTVPGRDGGRKKSCNRACGTCGLEVRKLIHKAVESVLSTSAKLWRLADDRSGHVASDREVADGKRVTQSHNGKRGQLPRGDRRADPKLKGDNTVALPRRYGARRTKIWRPENQQRRGCKEGGYSATLE